METRPPRSIVRISAYLRRIGQDKNGKRQRQVGLSVTISKTQIFLSGSDICWLDAGFFQQLENVDTICNAFYNVHYRHIAFGFVPTDTCDKIRVAARAMYNLAYTTIYTNRGVIRNTTTANTLNLNHLAQVRQSNEYLLKICTQRLILLRQHCRNLSLPYHIHHHWICNRKVKYYVCRHCGHNALKYFGSPAQPIDLTLTQDMLSKCPFCDSGIVNSIN